MIVAAVAVEALELLAAVVDSVAERNTVGLVELVVWRLLSMQLSDFQLNFQNTLHKLEVDSLAPEITVNRDSLN